MLNLLGTRIPIKIIKNYHLITKMCKNNKYHFNRSYIFKPFSERSTLYYIILNTCLTQPTVFGLHFQKTVRGILPYFLFGQLC